jgi:hypothetical protein
VAQAEPKQGQAARSRALPRCPAAVRRACKHYNMLQQRVWRGAGSGLWGWRLSQWSASGQAWGKPDPVCGALPRPRLWSTAQLSQPPNQKSPLPWRLFTLSLLQCMACRACRPLPCVFRGGSDLPSLPSSALLASKLTHNTGALQARDTQKQASRKLYMLHPGRSNAWHALAAFLLEGWRIPRTTCSSDLKLCYSTVLRCRAQEQLEDLSNLAISAVISLAVQYILGEVSGLARGQFEP